ncbi:ATP-binding protein [candidate division KSB1 bacterium]|nr:ATP-binding protein [candidate division KSB1 bacterium]NIR69836.1 ATP-binding protein [candidate division KSB1 bacterium]NIS24383.1 ATP-binding protein [candidate division KSB1 bacterium]NIT71319.1 ATP-binding protein [candidate division KSB1 bacterium]NIU27614.1 ATP-binding protein [candidate division KSB1 bacterium]
MPRTHKKYDLKLPSQSDNLSIVREFVSNVASKVGFDNDDISKIELAVDEACANVIKHAYGQNSGELIEVSIKIDKQKMIVVVTDKGRGFDPKNVKLPNMEDYLSEMRVGGLGIYLIETLMDKVDFEIKPGIRNKVKMIKYLDKDTPADKNASN